MFYNVVVYGKLRVCERGFSEGKSEASKRATNIRLAKTSNFLYTVLAAVIISLFQILIVVYIPFHQNSLLILGLTHLYSKSILQIR